MVGIFSFLLVASIIALAVAVVRLVLAAAKKKPKKPPAVMAAVSVALLLVSFVGIGLTYHPTPEQIAERERVAAEKAAEKEERERQAAEEAARKEAEEASKRESSTQSAEPAPSESEPVSAPSESAPASPSTDTSAVPSVPAESENPEQPPAPEEPPVAENPLYAAEVKTGDVMSGIGNNKIGEYAWIEMSKDAMLALSQEEMVSYAKDVISARKGSYNWFTIVMDDGTGLVFHNCFYPVFSYGVLDADGSLSETLGSGLLLDESVGYEYSPAEGNP